MEAGMFAPLIIEADTRFHLGDNATRFVRMLVDAIFDSGSGGFSGMRRRFAAVGLGDLFSSWIGTVPGDNVLQPDQFNAGFGESPAHNIATRLGFPLAGVNLAGAWLLPKIVGMITRGGMIPDARPADYDRWFAPPAADTTSTTGHDAVVRGAGGWWRWLLGLLVLLALAFFGLRGCQQQQVSTSATAGSHAPASAEAAPVHQGNTSLDADNINATVMVSG
jgi:OOP family OmpA-OmpF porin